MFVSQIRRKGAQDPESPWFEFWRRVLDHLLPLIFHSIHADAMVTPALISIWILILAYVDAAQVSLRRANSECRPFQSSFSAHDISRSGEAPFQVVSPEGSVSAEYNNLKLYLDKPRGTVRTKHGMNDVVAEGATVNSTFVTLYVSSFSPSRTC